MKRCLPQVNISFFMFLKEQSKSYTTIGTKKRQFFSTVVFFNFIGRAAESYVTLLPF